MNGYDKSTGKKLLIKVLYMPGKSGSLNERSATITIQDIETKNYLVGEGTWLYASRPYLGDGPVPESNIFALRYDNTPYSGEDPNKKPNAPESRRISDESMYYVAAEMMFYIVTGQKYFGDCDPYAGEGGINEGDDLVYSNFFTQDLYDRCDGKGPFDQKPDLENAPTNNFQTAFREVALGSFQDNYVTNLGDSSSIISQKAKNKPETLKNGAQVYILPYCVAYVKDDKVQMMVCATLQGETASGIGLGKNFNLEKILAAYGKGYVKSYHRGRDLYEYKTLS